MTTYVLCKSAAVQPVVGTVQGGPPGSNLPMGSQLANLSMGGALAPGAPPTNQTFELVVTGTSTTSVSATAQILASNDGVNWINYGSTIVGGSAAPPVVQSSTGAAVWPYYSAIITAIAGTGAIATVTMNA